VLVDHARRRAAAKRGGGLERITLAEGVAGEEDRAYELLELEEALERYASIDARAARVVEMRVFGGLTGDEAAAVLGVSRRTVDGDWAMAKMWLTRVLSESS
jgi:RNA polymerase sigma factor (TIGR02999 family)